MLLSNRTGKGLSDVNYPTGYNRNTTIKKSILVSGRFASRGICLDSVFPAVDLRVDIFERGTAGDQHLPTRTAVNALRLDRDGQTRQPPGNRDEAEPLLVAMCERPVFEES